MVNSIEETTNKKENSLEERVVLDGTRIFKPGIKWGYSQLVQGC